MPQTTFPLPDRMISEIAARLPGASNMFRRFGIDCRWQGMCRWQRPPILATRTSARPSWIWQVLYAEAAQLQVRQRAVVALRGRSVILAGTVSSAWTDILPWAAALYMISSGR